MSQLPDIPLSLRGPLPCAPKSNVCRAILAEATLFQRAYPNDPECLRVAQEIATELCMHCPNRQQNETEEAQRAFLQFTDPMKRYNAYENATRVLEGMKYNFSQIAPTKDKNPAGNRNFHTVGRRNYAVDRDTSTTEQGLHIHPLDSSGNLVGLRISVDASVLTSDGRGYDYKIIASSHNGGTEKTVREFINGLSPVEKVDLLALAIKVGGLGKVKGDIAWTPLGKLDDPKAKIVEVVSCYNLPPASLPGTMRRGSRDN